MNDPWQLFAGHGASQRLALLRAIATQGSISAAARSCGISYKAAWQQVENMNRQSPCALVERVSGGRGGGGTRLTELGAQLLHAWDTAGSALQAADDSPATLPALSRLPLRTSARNQLPGRITRLEAGAVNDTVHIQLAGGQPLIAQVTRSSSEELALAPGRQVVALIKASWMALATPDAAAHIAVANRLVGSISRISPGAVNSEVILQLPGGGTLCVIADNDSIASLQLQTGSTASALFSAQHVILGIFD
ncbi:TOBE domain-containing protein [Vogesella sp. LIG4]|uniref:TOBE domain-containing protein n=1 Tax=Vogesella sp. LIG4 TaxID=1192162 RepID=UPI00081F92EE|nr:TOBE domain-containing protein [Vogesella sp. LIG4]SCK24083.1 molybdate transport system regulatory protein [Vogesella sp. LIG4]